MSVPARHPRAPDLVRWNDVPDPWAPASVLVSSWCRLRDAWAPAPAREALDRLGDVAALSRPVLVSRYTNVYPSEVGTALLFHGVSGAIDEVPRDCGRVVERRRDTGTPLVRGELADGQVAELFRRGHLTHHRPEEELERFVLYARRLRRNVRGATLPPVMLLPSYECNLRCPYCFQTPIREPRGRRPALMTEELVDDIFERAIPGAFGGLDEGTEVNLYGGEPFLPRHLPVVRRVLRHAARLGLKVSATTNGTLVHEVPELFGPGEGKIGFAQVTLDGPPSVHDRSRVPAAGGATFDGIVDNALLLARLGAKVTVRVNVTAETAGELPALAEALRGRGALDQERLPLSCHAVTPVRGFPADRPFPRTLTTWELQETLRRVGLERELGSPLEQVCGEVDELFGGDGSLQLLRTHHCMLGQRGSVAFGPAGDAYGCYEEAGDESRRIGRIGARGRLELEERAALLERRTVSSFEPCRSCSIALFCGGGCARRAEERHGTPFAEHCDARRELVAGAVVRVHGRRLAASPRA